MHENSKGVGDMNRRLFLKQFTTFAGCLAITPKTLIKKKIKPEHIDIEEQPKDPENAHKKSAAFLLGFFDGIIVEDVENRIIASAKFTEESFEHTGIGEYEIKIPPMLIAHAGSFGGAWLVKGDSKVTQIDLLFPFALLMEEDTIHIDHLKITLPVFP
jgi:hypothetical protein